MPSRNSKCILTSLQWARTPPSASWRFDSGRDRGPGDRPTGDRRPRERSPRRGGRTPSPRRGRAEYSPRKDDRRGGDYERRDRDRSRSPDDRDREMKDDRDRPMEDRENGTNGDDRKGLSLHLRSTPREGVANSPVGIDSPPPAHDELDTAE